MINPRAQVVLRVSPLSVGDENLITEALLRIEGVRRVEVDAQRQIVRADVASDREVTELVVALEQIERRAAVVTHTRGVNAPPPPSSPGFLKMKLFMRLLGRQVNCCSN